MQDKPLDRAERDLLAVLVQVTAERGPISREALSVESRGRGLEFGRSFARLKALGLIEEVERRPFLLLRLFGARSTFALRPTEAGRRTLAAMAEPPDATVVSEAALPVERAVEPPQGMVAVVAEHQPEPIIAPVPQAHAEPVAQEAPTPAEPEPVPAPPEAEPQPVVKARAPAAKRPRMLPLTAYTEVLGGAAVADEAAPMRAQVDPEVVASLREVLSGLGIDLTMAGEMLIGDRLAKGASAAEALSQVVVYTFAHVVHHDLLHGRAVEALGLEDFAVEVRHELQKLHDAGEIGAAAFAADMGQLDTLITSVEARGALAEALLQDPFGGAAPPAVLPEELRGSEASDEA